MSTLRQIGLGVLLLLAVGAYFYVSHLRQEVAEGQATINGARADHLAAALVAARQDVPIVTHYVMQVQLQQTHGATLLQQVPTYVPDQANRRCVIPVGFVRLHDAAAQGAGAADLPAGSRTVNAAPSEVTLAGVGATVVDNYTSCHVTAERLTDLQAWVRAHGGAPAKGTGPP